MGLLTSPGLLTPKYLKPKGNWLGSPGGEVNQSLRQIVLQDGNTVGWFAPGVGVTGTLNVSTWADQSGLGHDLVQATGANQPIYLLHTGTNYLWISGVAGNSASTPDTTSLSIAGDIDLRWYGALDDYTPGGIVALVSKWGAGGQRSYALQLDTTGKVIFVYTVTGIYDAAKDVLSSAACGVTDATATWLRATYASATGKVNFYKSTAGTTWTAIGTEQTITSGAIFDSTAAVYVGALQPDSGTERNAAGKHYRAQIYDGIAGTLVFDANFQSVAEGSTTFTESSSNAATVTINSTGATPAQIVGSPSLLADGTAHKLATANFTLDQPCEYFLVAKPITWTAGDYLCSGTAGVAGITQVTGTPKIGLNAGSGVADNTNAVLGSYAIIYAAFNGASSELQVNLTTATTGNAGAGNPGGLSLFSDNGGINYGNWQVKEMIARSVVSNTATRLAIQTALARKHGITI